MRLDEFASEGILVCGRSAEFVSYEQHVYVHAVEVEVIHTPLTPQPKNVGTASLADL